MPAVGGHNFVNSQSSTPAVNLDQGESQAHEKGKGKEPEHIPRLELNIDSDFNTLQHTSRQSSTADYPKHLNMSEEAIAGNFPGMFPGGREAGLSKNPTPVIQQPSQFGQPPTRGLPPLTADNGEMPNLIPSQLVGMAISQSPNDQLSKREICAWIQNYFSYYKNNPEKCERKIRSAITTSTCFENVGTRGGYGVWRIIPGRKDDALTGTSTDLPRNLQWTPDDDRIVRDGKANGLTNREIGARLSPVRGPGRVGKRWAKLKKNNRVRTARQGFSDPDN